ncbi:IclR family transcriptional regulator [Knoellia sp. 3-2P3]|uniref:IclR family transcriptional regulator n=1 Tax=unclassified Knoellia TaxID=2618719 RepID=UPI0023D9EA45|nr:IclR family transcriptional regulator [Knoellia sp. 3-2P3]MDF2092543.1 IclR family transcriptional regulator [Knoellia sp. 3-2P3]
MPGSVQSVERAAAIVRLLAAESEPLGLAQISGALGLAKPTAHGLLRTLCEVEFVDKDEVTGLYRVGRDLLQLGSTQLDVNELRSRAINWTDALAARTGESARVAMFRGGAGVIAHHVFRVAAGHQTLDTGATIALHATALGKVLIAFDPGAARSVLDGPLEALTSRTLTDRPALIRQLADVRDAGYAVAVEESERGQAGIAAPIRDRGGYVVAAVGVTGPVDSLCDGRGHPRAALADDVLWAARAISREFGHGRS